METLCIMHFIEFISPIPMVKWKGLWFCAVRWKTVYLSGRLSALMSKPARGGVEKPQDLENCAIVLTVCHPFLIITSIKTVWLVIEILLDLQRSQRVPESALSQTWELQLLLWRHVSFSFSFFNPII